MGVADDPLADVGPPARPRSRHRAGRAGSGRARLGLHLLLEPPPHAREPVHVGDPRRAPFERALQPVHGAPPAGCGGVRHVRPVQLARPCSASAPRSIGSARSINLLYQYWIHTDAINRLGPVEGVLNTPSAHRVHHGSNGRYLDRNHGSILIVWDRLFGTFEEEDEPVVYGLTRNINTFRPSRIASHEHLEMSADVARARTWRDRISYVVRGPGWSYAPERGTGRGRLRGRRRCRCLRPRSKPRLAYTRPAPSESPADGRDGRPDRIRAPEASSIAPPRSPFSGQRAARRSPRDRPSGRLRRRSAARNRSRPRAPSSSPMATSTSSKPK